MRFLRLDYIHDIKLIVIFTIILIAEREYFNIFHLSGQPAGFTTENIFKHVMT